MTQNTDPFSMVRPASSAQMGLLALGWTVTDTLDGWDHMEPPLVPKLLGVDTMMVVTAPEIADEDLDALRDAIDAALQDPDFAIVTTVPVQIETIPFDQDVLDDGPWDVVATRKSLPDDSFRYSTSAIVGKAPPGYSKGTIRKGTILALGTEGFMPPALFSFPFGEQAPAEGGRFQFEVVLTPLPDSA